MLTRVILAALVAGLLAGVFATAAQSVRVIPLILQAEAYEEGVSHAETEDEVWAPEEGLQRTFFTLLSNLVTGVAFALILTAIILILDQPVSLRHGALWGAGGFAVFVLAPNFGLPPELRLHGSDSLPDGGKSPSIRADVLKEKGWTVSNLAYALKTGIQPDGDAFGGSMGEVVRDGTSFLSQDDLTAIATFLLEREND